MGKKTIITTQQDLKKKMESNLWQTFLPGNPSNDSHIPPPTSVMQDHAKNPNPNVPPPDTPHPMESTSPFHDDTYSNPERDAFIDDEDELGQLSTIDLDPPPTSDQGPKSATSKPKWTHFRTFLCFFTLGLSELARFIWHYKKPSSASSAVPQPAVNPEHPNRSDAFNHNSHTQSTMSDPYPTSKQSKPNPKNSPPTR